MASSKYQICTRCVMDTTDLDITFDAQGLCNNCTDFLGKRAKHKYQGAATDQELLRIVAQIKKAGQGKEYDCVMGMSGGIDSSYSAYVAKQHGLRVLALHMDNGWNSDDAALNIKNVTQKLGIDYESYVLDWEEFKDLQLSFLKASVPEAETPTDMAIPAAMHAVAAKYGVKYIISGGNFATEGILPRSWHYNAKDTTYLKDIQKTFGTKPLKRFPLFGFVEEIYYKVFKRIQIIYLLNYVPYSKKDSMHILETELNWRYYGGKHYESKYTGFIQSYYLFKKFGFDYRRATLSTQICTGEVTREEALLELKSLPYDEVKVKHEKDYIAKKLGITLAEFEQIIDAPAKSYRDYRNNEKWLGFIYDMYRKLYKKEKLANF
jgi:N-acetyl sugar amidotransferase